MNIKNIVLAVKYGVLSVKERCFRLRILWVMSFIGVCMSLAGCIGESYYAPPPRYEPITLALEELRAPVKVQPPAHIKVNGKIVLYGKYLLVNEPAKGVHIFDNADPKQPKALGFLPILGVTDVSIKNDLLYADSYIDLVVYDISDIADVKLKHRLEKAFDPLYRAASYGVNEKEEIVIGLVRIYTQGGV